MIAKKVYEYMDFEKGKNPYDSLQIGRVKQRKYAGYKSFMKWLKSFKNFNTEDILENCYFNDPYRGNEEKEKIVFLGKSADDIISGKEKYNKEILPLYLSITQYLYPLDLWSNEIAKKTIEEYENLKEIEKEEEESKIEGKFEDKHFFPNMIKYFIDKWPGEVHLEESINFERIGEPFEKLKIGKYRSFPLKDALLQSEPDPEIDNWLKDEPNLSKAIGYYGTSNDWQHILGIDVETYCDENNIDAEDLHKDFREEEEIKSSRMGGLNIKIGKLRDGSAAVYYYGGIVDGYLTRKEWLK
ncbi:MAG: hypothetical protein PHF86_00605 [Candidatus Nanoarchaeia archaeon]|nr:hypothetical protein [Candidatus Nanoarchaeia archaeon]